MAVQEQDPRDRIMQATVDLLNEADDPDQITIRQIAGRAGVGVGLINYHFQSKENLLNEAVAAIMGQEAARWLDAANQPDADPVTRLKALLRETSRVAFQYPLLSQISVSHALMEADLTVEQMALPLLREIYQNRRDEREMRLLAFTLIKATQAALLCAGALRDFSGIDLYDERQRSIAIDIMVDTLVRGQGSITAKAD